MQIDSGSVPKVQLKLQMSHGTKKIRRCPESFLGLQTLVMENVKDQDVSYLLWYMDESEDWITIMDDDDIQLAIEFAEQHSQGCLKVHVKPVEGSKTQDTKVNDSTKASKAPVEKVSKKASISKAPKKKATAPIKSLEKKKKSKEAAAGPAMTERVHVPQLDMNEQASSSSDGEDFMDLKAYIQETVKKSTDKMMESFSEIKMAETSNMISDDFDQIDTNIRSGNPALDESMYPNEVHRRVICDGCGMSPIVGVRYKCSVLKDFDYCEKCEATKDHKYAFLKIKREKDAPRAIFTTIDESHGNAPVDIDINDPNNLLKNFFAGFENQTQESRASTANQPQSHRPPHHGPPPHHSGHHRPPHHGPPPHHWGPPSHHFGQHPPPHWGPPPHNFSGSQNPTTDQKNEKQDGIESQKPFDFSGLGSVVKDIMEKNGEQFKELGKQLHNNPDIPKGCLSKWFDSNGNLNKEAINKKTEEFGKKMQEWCQPSGPPHMRGGPPHHWGGPRHHWGGPRHHWGGRGGPCGGWGGPGAGFKMNRCRLIKGPEGTLTGRPGETIFIEAEFRNNTEWPYKPGSQLVSFETPDSDIIEDVKMPVQEVMGMTSFTLLIPVKIKNSVAPREYELMFGLQGPRGWAFGETLIVKMQVLEKIDDMEVFKQVKAIIDKHPDQKYSFEETLKAYKAVGCNEEKAMEYISKKRQEEAMKFAKESTQSMFKDDENDDLYS